MVISTTICIGCRRNCPRYTEKRPRKRIGNSDAVANLKQKAHWQLNGGLSSRPIQLQGITDPLPIGSVIGVEYDEFISFHSLVEKASKNNELAQLFEFVAEDGSTFVANEAHTARFQNILAQEEDHIDGMAATRILTLENPIVSKIYQGLVKLRNIFSTEVYPIPGKRQRTPPIMAAKGTRWGNPTVLFSKGKNDNRSVPRSAFVDQALHCDYQPEVANRNANLRGKPVPFSIIVNCSAEDAIILGCGLSPLEVIGHKRFTRKPLYEDLPDPVPISIPTGCMVAFRGDFVHAGTCYSRNHTRLFMGLHLIDDSNAVNSTCLEEDEKHLPRNIMGVSSRDPGSTSLPKRLPKASGMRKKRKATK